MSSYLPVASGTSVPDDHVLTFAESFSFAGKAMHPYPSCHERARHDRARLRSAPPWNDRGRGAADPRRGSRDVESAVESSLELTDLLEKREEGRARQTWIDEMQL